MARQKRKYKITPVEAQRRKVDALERWFDFVNGKRAITPENFGDELLSPAVHALRRKAGYSPSDAALTPDEIEALRMELKAAFEKLADGQEWRITGAQLALADIVISQLGTGYEGRGDAQSRLLIAGLIQGEEWRAGHCAWCGKLFSKRKRGLFCDTKCAQRMRTKRHRDPRWTKAKEARARKRGISGEQLASEMKKQWREG